ncbi:ABC transporter ATP-binding protein [Thermofilum pendens]|uniref:ABC transporter related n=1 Tax=Thermofilum pendens (strain DSM 2475 / Hrk 5) TaxID=368408 RepID=A1S043_THEPD|nr:ABC transporter ATP-binding protein [Thermofilum pendens]ABL78823.1 ABC transporter related [Thermofilum pendens Hrk 5]
MPLLKVLGVTVYYGDFKALGGVSFDVERGEILSIIGPNGSGKTTLLRAIDGILRPRLGAVYLDGREIAGMERREIARIIGYSPQRVDVQSYVTVLDFVLTGRRPYASWDYSESDYRKAVEALRAVNASHLAARRLDQLSGGEFRRVVIARALAGEPDVLLLDEPTNDLDPKHQVEILSAIRRLASGRGVAVVMCLHDLTHAYRYSDKILAMKDGSVYAFGRPEDVMREDLLREVYGVSLKVLPEHRAVIIDHSL